MAGVAPDAMPSSETRELETRTMHVFISRALQKVLKECPKKHTQLRQSCAAVIEELKERGAETFPLPTPEVSTDSPPSTPQQLPSPKGDTAALERAMDSTKLDDQATPGGGAMAPAAEDDDEDGSTAVAGSGEMVVSGADKYFVPLRLACESKLPRIMEVALACIQKLIAYGYVKGKVVQVGKQRMSMMDVVMETICSCKDQEDELVQLQIVKAVLTAVTSSVSAVHETTLLLAVKTCFYIFLVSKSATIQSTANAALAQLLNVFFQQRCELQSPPHPHRPRP